MSQRQSSQNDENLGFLRDLNAAVRAHEPEESDCQAARRDLLAKLESIPEENPIMSIFRRSGSTKMKWAAASVIVTLAVALVVVLRPWGGGSTELYAEAVEQLNSASSLSFVSSVEGRPGVEWVYKEPRRFRQTFPDGKILILDYAEEKTKGLWLTPKEKTYTTFTQSRLLPLAGRLIDNLKSLPERADGVLETREMNGRTVQGFRARSKRHANGVIANVVWVDAETANPVRVEGKIVDGRSGRTYPVTMRDIHLKTVDDPLLELTVPKGYHENADMDDDGDLDIWLDEPEGSFYFLDVDSDGDLDVLIDTEVSGGPDVSVSEKNQEK